MFSALIAKKEYNLLFECASRTPLSNGTFFA